MKKKALSLALALALCLGLALRAMAAGETVLIDEEGNKYHRSNPVVAEQFWKGAGAVYQVPDGTAVRFL